MAGVFFMVDVSGLEPLEKRIARLAKGDRRRLAINLGSEVENQTRRRITSEKTSPDGKRWAPLSKQYADWKRKFFGDVGLLELHGDLVDSIQYDARSDQVEVGTNLPYGAILQFGGADIGKPNFKARAYLGLSPENEVDLVRVANDYFAALLA